VSDARGSQLRCFLSEGLRTEPGCTPSVTGPSPPLMELQHPSEFFSELASTRIGWMLPSCPRPKLGYRVFTGPGSRAHSERKPGNPLMGLCSPTESSKLERPPASSAPERVCTRAAPPMRFLPLQRLPARGSGIVGRVSLARPPAPPGFLNLLVLRSAPSLPALFHAGSAHGVAPFRALLLPCSRTPFPAPLPSCRWTSPPTSPPARARRPKPPDPFRLMEKPRKRPRLQGFSPHESPPPTADGLGRRRARSSPGLSALQGVPPRWNGSALTAPPLMAFARWARTTI
jgi:hypothetical protein